MNRCDLVAKGGVACAILNLIGNSVNSKAYEYAARVFKEEANADHPFDEDKQMLLELSQASSTIAKHLESIRLYFKSIVGVENYEIK